MRSDRGSALPGPGGPIRDDSSRTWSGPSRSACLTALTRPSAQFGSVRPTSWQLLDRGLNSEPGWSKTSGIAHLLSAAQQAVAPVGRPRLSRADRSCESRSACLPPLPSVPAHVHTAGGGSSPVSCLAAKLRLTTRRAACSSSDPRRITAIHMAGTDSFAPRS